MICFDLRCLFNLLIFESVVIHCPVLLDYLPIISKVIITKIYILFIRCRKVCSVKFIHKVTTLVDKNITICRQYLVSPVFHSQVITSLLFCTWSFVIHWLMKCGTFAPDIYFIWHGVYELCSYILCATKFLVGLWVYRLFHSLCYKLVRNL